jgi:hypothetical protein
MIFSVFEWLDFQDRQALKIDSSLPGAATLATGGERSTVHDDADAIATS